MNVEVRAAETGFPDFVNPLVPVLWPVGLECGKSLGHLNAWNSVLPSGWQQTGNQLGGWVVSGSALNDIHYAGTATGPSLSIQTFGGALQGYGFDHVSPARRFNLANVSDAGQSVLSYVSGSFSLAEPHGLILEYSSQTPNATSLVANTVAACVMNAAPSADSSSALASAVVGAFGSADFVEFEDGIENEFTTRIIDLVKEHGGVAVEKLASKIFRPGVRPEIVAQTLLCFARIEDEMSFRARSEALRQGLLSPSSNVRDAATVGIIAIGDVSARADLVAAIAREKIRGLREDMQVALSYLPSAK
jgi:hypothetical protein